MTNETDDTEVVVQKGQNRIEHRNIDSPGEDHPFGEDPRSFEADLRTILRRVADDLYNSWEATIREYLANAETACLRVEEYLETGDSTMLEDGAEMTVSNGYQPKIEITWDKSDDTLTIKDNGIGMSANVVDEVFRQIGRSTNRDEGSYAGAFGQGVMSVFKFIGLDNAMIMTSHSRINDDNASYYVSLSGVEPIKGSLDPDEYGTKFQMTPKENLEIRQAVERYAEWMRVPVKYEEIGRDGTIEFEEDWGDKALYEEYEDNRICLGVRKRGAFEAYCSPDADARTLLLSMDIDRNDGDYSPGQHGAPFPFDVRLLDESGKIIESTNGNEGLMPINDTDYEQMLKEARKPYITESLLNKRDVIGQKVVAGPNAGKMVVSDEALDSGKPMPAEHDYLPKSEVESDDEPGQPVVIFGPHEGRQIVSEDEWDEMDAGRAERYVPESEIEPYDVETGEGDLALPQPTSDRDRLQEHETFWQYVGQQFAEQFDEKVDEVYEMIDGANDPLEAIMDLEPEDLVVSPAGFEGGE